MPYYEPRIVEARDALVLEYLNRGFASAAVERRVERERSITRGST